MKEILVIIYFNFLSTFTFSQTWQVDSLGKGSDFFLEVKKITCPFDYNYGDCITYNPFLNCYQTKLIDILPYTRYAFTTRIKSNDSLKLEQCISLKLSKNTPIYKCKSCEFAIEEAFNCQIIDSIINSKVWVLRTGKFTQLKTLKFAQYIEEHRFALGVYTTQFEDDAVQDAIIAKNGQLSQLHAILENMSKHIVLLEDESQKKEKFTFEISKSLIERGDFEEIKAALKEAIDFDLYEAVRPVKIKYVKFLE